MHGMLLFLHVGAASLMVGGTLLTLVGAWLRRGSLLVSKWGLLASGATTVLSGIGLVITTGQGMGRVCVLGTALVAVGWGAYFLMRLRFHAPVHA